MKSNLGSRFFGVVVSLTFLAALGVVPAEAADKDSLRRQCQRGEAKACADLALIERDAGNNAEARHLLESACSKDYAPACFRLGSLELAAGNATAGRKWLNTACSKKVAAACSRLAALAHDANHPDEAKKYYELACGVPVDAAKSERGIAAVACFNLRDIERQAGNEARAAEFFEKGVKHFEKNCAGGDQMSCNALSAEKVAEQRRKTGR
ncbi:MAG TPA: hypothetical protein PLP17_17055 [Oligoflexia bacterium]|nr:hypothetical protein [Oligoflexia bacterium]